MGIIMCNVCSVLVVVLCDKLKYSWINLFVSVFYPAVNSLVW